MAARTPWPLRAFHAVAMLLSFLSAPAFAADAPRIGPAELKEMMGRPGVAIVDVRVDAATAGTRIPGSRIEDPAQYVEWSKKYPKDRTIVLYCSWHEEGTSARVALRLIELGYSKVYALKGGWKEWERLGYPVEKK